MVKPTGQSLLTRSLLASVLLVAALAVLSFTRAATADNESADYPAASLTAPPNQAALIARGKYLVTAADCAPCHTGPNHAPFSGGLVMQTPYGGLATPNITPDPTTGIGSWSEADFYKAIHDGIAPGHDWLIFPRFLYPAMPYTSYTKLSRPDIDAIRAYLMSLAPVKIAPTPSTMAFPFNQRPVLLGWRLLFFHAGPMAMNPTWSNDLKNGAYLTEALGHCGECHTPRNLLSAMELGRAYAGAPIDNLFAPNISSSKTDGVGGWATSDLVAYLHDDGNMTKGSPFGAMGEMTDNSTSQLPLSDDQDIALYLQTATAPQSNPATSPAPDATASITRGQTLYANNCAACHGAAGKGMGPNMVPPLAGNNAATAAQPYNIIGAALGGLDSWGPNGPPMPAFGAALSDQQIADIANYVRTSFGNNATPNATAAMVMALRGAVPLPGAASFAADQLGCPRVSASGSPGTVADPGSNLLAIYADATPATLPNRTRALIAQVKSANPTISQADLADTLLAAYCPVLADQPGMSLTAKQAALTQFLAGAQPELAGN
jgi:mono/diheme cytochrome c family protein